MAKTFAELERLSLSDLKAEYDRHASMGQAGLNFYRDEIARREATEHNGVITDLTSQMRNMTVAILFLTIINVVVASVALWAVSASNTATEPAGVRLPPEVFSE